MRKILVALGIVAALAMPVGAQNMAPAFSHGPTIQFITVSFDSAQDASASVLSSGAGYSFNFNLFPSADGSIRWATVGFPLFVQMPSDSHFQFAPGATLGFFNNLVSVGAAFNAVNINGEDRGFLIGAFDKRDVRLLINIGFNFGGGVQTATFSSNLLGKATAASDTPPPNYIRW